MIRAILAVVAVLFASWTDYRTSQIPNRLTYTSLIAGLGLSVAGWGPSPGASVMGLCVGGGLFLALWFTGALGAGDVKLMAALGALLAWPRIWDVVFYTALAGGALAILFLVWRRIPAVVVDGGDAQALPRRKQKMPYAVAIAAGTLLALFLG